MMGTVRTNETTRWLPWGLFVLQVVSAAVDLTMATPAESVVDTSLGAESPHAHSTSNATVQHTGMEERI